MAACHTPGIRGVCFHAEQKRVTPRELTTPQLNGREERSQPVTANQPNSTSRGWSCRTGKSFFVSLHTVSSTTRPDCSGVAHLLHDAAASEAYTQHASGRASWVPRQSVCVPTVSPPECPEAQNWVWEACQAETIIHVQMPSGSGRGEVWAWRSKKSSLMFNYVSLWCLQRTSAFLVVHHALQTWWMYRSVLVCVCVTV